MFPNKKRLFFTIAVSVISTSMLLYVFFPQLKGLFIKPSVEATLTADKNVFSPSRRDKLILDKDEYTVLYIKYRNNTEKKLTGIQVKLKEIDSVNTNTFFIKGSQMRLAKKLDAKTYLFEAPNDLAPHISEISKIAAIRADQPGSLTLLVEITTKDGVTAQTNTVTIQSK